MIIKGSDHFKKLITEFIETCKSEVLLDGSKAAVDGLEEALNSSDAIAFTEKMNKLYEKQGITDSNGDILTLQHPNDFASRVILNPDGKGTFSITSEEDRWIRANQLYGNNILGKLGFKYTDE